MLFNSLAFGIFLPIVFILYWIIPHKYRWIMLLAASCYFYMSWNPKYVLLIFIMSFVTWEAGKLVYAAGDIRKKKLWIVIAIAVCIGILSFFKYFNFASNSFTKLLNLISIPVQPFTLKLLLPVGISFYTFQSLGYAIDVYPERSSRKRISSDILCLFLSFRR